jgi:hypothetical protein
VLLGDLARVIVRPSTAYDGAVVSRARGAAAGIVLAAGLVAAALSAAGTALEPPALVDSAAGYGFSALLPILFVGFWLIDATIVDAVAQLMQAPSRLWTWAVASAHAIPLLIGFELVRVLQAAVDRAGALDLATGLGFLEFVVIAWFIWVLTAGIQAVYGVARFNAVAVALAPPAAVMMLLLVLLVAATILHLAGVG